MEDFDLDEFELTEDSLDSVDDYEMDFDDEEDEYDYSDDIDSLDSEYLDDLEIEFDDDYSEDLDSLEVENFSEHGVSSDDSDDMFLSSDESVSLESLDDDLDNLLSNTKFTREFRDVSVKNIIISETYKTARRETIQGLTATVSAFGGVLVPINVIEMDLGGGEYQYMLIEGVRRLYGAVRNNKSEIPAFVWKFDNIEKATKVAFLLGLIINKQQSHNMKEVWDSMQVLEQEYNLRPTQIERLFNNLQGGDAMKLKDVALADHAEPREELFSGNKTLEQSYKLLQKLRKEEDLLAIEDATSITDGSGLTDETLNADERVQALTDEEVKEILEIAQPIGVSDLTDDMFTEKLVEDTLQNRRADGDDDLPHAVKEAIKERDNRVCQCCSKDHPENSSSFISQLVVHHKIPVHAGGTDNRDNLITLCIGCHHALHTMELEGRFMVTKEQFDKLTEDRQRILLNAYNLAKIAIIAGQKKGYDRKKRKEVTRDSLRHKFPGYDLKADRAAINSK